MRILTLLLVVAMVFTSSGCRVGEWGSSGDDGTAQPADSTYTIGGSVSGLTGTLVLQNNLGDDLTLTSDGDFTFPTAMDDGAFYSVTILSVSPGQDVVLADVTGTVSGADVTNIGIACTTHTFTIGGSISGHTSDVILQNNGAETLTVPVGDTTFEFTTPVAYGGSYAVTVDTQPTGQTCVISGGSGSNVQADIDTVGAACTTVYTVGGTVTGYDRDLTLQNNFGDALAISADGTFTFSAPMADGEFYSVTASGPTTHYIAVIRSAGEIDGANVTNVQVTVTTTFTNIAGIEFVWIPAGSFMMGSPASGDPEAELDEKPEHEVTLTKGFWMGKYEVTQAQWLAFMGTNPSFFDDSGSGPNTNPDNPVDSVSWYDCQTFISILNILEDGSGYKLPTEAQWEYACRAGTTTTRYNGTYVPDTTNLGLIAWYNVNSATLAYPSGQTHPVGQKLPNAWGLYDMMGNVWERCNDCYGAYSSSPGTDPDGSASGSYRVIRGGGLDYEARRCRSAYRHFDIPAYSNYGLGFRLVFSSSP